MRKTIKILFLLMILAGAPALAGLGIAALWNNIVTSVCGFAAISFWQGVGLFLLGQLLSSGFIIVLFMTFGSLHAIIHSRAHWHSHWHSMTDEQQREFIERRRRDMRHFGFRNHNHTPTDDGE